MGTLESRYAEIEQRIALTQEGGGSSAERLVALKALAEDAQWLLDRSKLVVDLAIGYSGKTTVVIDHHSYWGTPERFVSAEELLEALGEPTYDGPVVAMAGL